MFFKTYRFGHVLLAMAFAGCAGGPGEAPGQAPMRAATRTAQPPEAPPAAGELPAAVLPDDRGPMFPALTQLAGPVSGATLADTATCSACHADIAAQWQASAHAFASFNNPIYRTSVDRFRDVHGRDRSRFCAGCHDPALLVDGAMDAPIAARDARAHAGVTCRTCHAIEHATFDGNGSYRLSATELATPDREDPASVAAHKLAARPAALGTAQMCGSCHRAFLGEATGHPHYMPGTDDIGPWLHSAHAGSHVRRVDDGVTEKTCTSCHMPREQAEHGDAAADPDGTVASHRFLGGHTWMAAMRGDPALVERTQAALQGLVSVDVAAVTISGGPDDGAYLPADGAPVGPGRRAVFDVALRNLGVGHNFPGGTRDAQDTIVELQLLDRAGAVLATTAEPHRLGSAVIDESGAPQLAREIEGLRTPAYDHTIAPRDARVVRFAVDVPKDISEGSFPLRAVARVVHRSRTEALREVTCADGRSKRGRAFVAATTAMTGERIDPCAAQPATEIARAEVQVGRGAAAVPGGRRDAERLYVHGLGLLHEVQEQVGRARASFERALALAPADDPRLRAQILVGLATVAGQQGRVDEAAALADEAAALVPGHPAPAWSKGQAYAAVWRWEQAVGPLQAAATAAPKDPLARAALALALGSAARPGEALAAAQAGLKSGARRNPDLLRLQALALTDLEAGDAAAAMAAYLAHRPPDDAPHWRAACSRSVAGCARERVPVHEHALVWR